MRLALIDCGTNTFNLLVVETDHTQFKKTVFNTRISVKLGQDSINEGIIGEAALERALLAIDTFHKHLLEYRVDKTLAYATSAIRDASNGQEFVQLVHERYGIRIEVINGDREAELIYLGVKAAVMLGEQPSLIMDIGGGSTEFIVANSQGILWKHSFNIGAARLLEKFKPSDPISEAEKNAIQQHLRKATDLLFESLPTFRLQELVGSSGAFDSIIEMIHGEFGGEALVVQKTEYHVDPHHLDNILNKVMQSTLAERKNIKGLVPMRFDMIVISCLMIRFVMQSFAIPQLRVSTYSLKEGALADFLNNPT